MTALAGRGDHGAPRRVADRPAMTRRQGAHDGLPPQQIAALRRTPGSARKLTRRADVKTAHGSLVCVDDVLREVGSCTACGVVRLTVRNAVRAQLAHAIRRKRFRARDLHMHMRMARGECV